MLVTKCPILTTAEPFVSFSHGKKSSCPCQWKFGNLRISLSFSLSTNRISAQFDLQFFLHFGRLFRASRHPVTVHLEWKMIRLDKKKEKKIRHRKIWYAIYFSWDFFFQNYKFIPWKCHKNNLSSNLWKNKKSFTKNCWWRASAWSALERTPSRRNLPLDRISSELHCSTIAHISAFMSRPVNANLSALKVS